MKKRHTIGCLQNVFCAQPALGACSLTTDLTEINIRPTAKDRGCTFGNKTIQSIMLLPDADEMKVLVFLNRPFKYDNRTWPVVMLRTDKDKYVTADVDYDSTVFVSEDDMYERMSGLMPNVIISLLLLTPVDRQLLADILQTGTFKSIRMGAPSIPNVDLHVSPPLGSNMYCGELPELSESGLLFFLDNLLAYVTDKTAAILDYDVVAGVEIDSSASIHAPNFGLMYLGLLEDDENEEEQQVMIFTIASEEYGAVYGHVCDQNVMVECRVSPVSLPITKMHTKWGKPSDMPTLEKIDPNYVRTTSKSVSKATASKSVKPANPHNPTLPAIEKAPVDETPVKRAPVRKASVKKPPVKKPSVKKPPVTKPSVKKASVKKTPIKETPVKKAPIRQVTVKKASLEKTPVTRAVAKKAPIRQVTVKKASLEKTPVTRAAAKKAPVKFKVMKTQSPTLPVGRKTRAASSKTASQKNLETTRDKEVEEAFAQIELADKAIDKTHVPTFTNDEQDLELAKPIDKEDITKLSRKEKEAKLKMYMQLVNDMKYRIQLANKIRLLKFDKNRVEKLNNDLLLPIILLWADPPVKTFAELDSEDQWRLRQKSAANIHLGYTANNNKVLSSVRAFYSTLVVKGDEEKNGKKPSRKRRRNS